MINPSATPTLPDLQAELRHHLVVMAVILNDTYGPPALRAVLHAESPTDDEAIAAFDVHRTRLGAFVPVAYDFAVHGRLTDAVAQELDNIPNCLDIVGDLVTMLERSDLAEALWTDCAGTTNYAPGGLRHLIDLARARADLDNGEPLDARQLALLAGMTERSVQNAFSQKGPQQLHGTRKEGRFSVTASEARRWLAGRRGFTPTVRVAPGIENAVPPHVTTAQGLRAYLREVVQQKRLDMETIAARASVNRDELDRAFAGETPIGLPLARRLAGTLTIDERWLLLQVLELDYPHETALLRSALREA